MGRIYIPNHMINASVNKSVRSGKEEGQEILHGFFPLLAFFLVMHNLFFFLFAVFLSVLMQDSRRRSAFNNTHCPSLFFLAIWLYLNVYIIYIYIGEVTYDFLQRL